MVERENIPYKNTLKHPVSFIIVKSFYFSFTPLFQKRDLFAAPVSSNDVKLEDEAAQTHKDNVVYDTSSVASTADTCMDNSETNGITS